VPTLERAFEIEGYFHRGRAGSPWHIHHDLLLDQGKLPGLKWLLHQFITPIVKVARIDILSARLQDDVSWEFAFYSQSSECDE
jgi:hypothetical protein